MTTSVLVARADTYASENAPTRNHGPDTPLLVAGASGTQRMAYLAVPLALPDGAVVLAATLYLKTKDATTGVVDLRVRKVIASWSAGKLTWQNRPATSATDEASLSVAAGGDGRTLAVGVTALVQGIVDAGGYFGLRLSTPTTSAQVLRVRSTEVQDPDNRPFLVVDYVVQAEPPVGLEPNGANVALTHPTLRWQLPGGSQIAYEVEVSSNADFTSPSEDTGWVSSTDPQHALTVALASGALKYWRVRIRDEASQESDWSDPATLTYLAPPTVTITGPTSPTAKLRPLLVWTYSGTYPQESYEVAVIDAATDELIELVPRAISTATSHELSLLPRLGTYRVRLRVWDDVDRPGGGSGATPYVEQTLTLVHASGAHTGASALNATPVLPFVNLTWTGSAAGGYVVRRDGLLIAEVAAGVFAYQDWGGRPDLLYAVDPVNASGEVGVPTTDGIDPDEVPLGIWLLDPEAEVAVQLLGQAPGTWEVGEAASTIVPLAGVPLRITQNLRGYEGSMAGVIAPGAADPISTTPTGATQRADLYLLKAAAARGAVLRLAAGRENLPVLLGAVSLSPHPVQRDHYAVTFEYAQVAEFPMTLAEAQ